MGWIKELLGSESGEERLRSQARNILYQIIGLEKK